MVKQKKSFMERLTGSKNIEEPHEEAYAEHMHISSKDSAEPHQISIPHTPEYESDDFMRQQEDQSIGSWDEGEQEMPSEEGDEGQLTIDVFQTDNDIVIKSTIAGVKPEDLDVSINNDMVTIKGERKFEEEVSEEDFYYQECYWGSFARSVVLPVDVLPEKAEASLKNGILTIRLPKAEANKVKKIQVRGF